MSEEQRENLRYEPSLLAASITTKDGINTYCGRVLDISRKGIAISIPEMQPNPDINSIIELELIRSIPEKTRKTIGEATVLRKWPQPGDFSEGHGFSVKLEKELPSTGEDGSFYFSQAIEQKRRIKAQAALAKFDIEYLGNYRRSLTECQMKLFVLTLTAGVALFGIFFSLTYHSVSINMFNDPTLAFWRTLIAALPGTLAIACALLVAQKSTSIQRIDAYLAILKERVITNKYHREYKGWESDLRRFRRIFKSDACNKCRAVKRCTDVSNGKLEELKERSVFRKPRIDLFHLIINMTFLFFATASIAAIILSVLNFNWGAGIFMLVSSFITIFLVLTSIWLFSIFKKLRKGEFSIEYYHVCWTNILKECEY